MIAFNTTFHIEYSLSNTGNVHGSCTIDFVYCMSLINAFEYLIRENYNSFILTIGCITVSIYVTTNGTFKIFDSHAKDSFGMSHPQGTCVLLEVQTLNKLIEYFQVLHSMCPGISFELRGVHITKVQTQVSEITQIKAVQCQQSFACQSSDDNDNNNDLINDDIESVASFMKCCCAISFYSICFSIIKPCSYWNESTLDAICDYGNTFNEKLRVKSEQRLSINDFPNRLQIYDADIDITFKLEKGGFLCFESSNSRLILQKLICDNMYGNTGFLLWLSNYCLACIFQYNLRIKNMKYYLITFNDDGSVKIFNNFCDVECLIEMIIDTARKELGWNEVHYCIKFLLCSCEISNTLRQKIMRKHKPYGCKQLIANREKYNYREMEPSKKRRCLSNKAEWYKSLDSTEKEKLLSDKAEWYKGLDTIEKQKVLSRNGGRYKSLDTKEKQKLLSDRAEWYKSLDVTEKRKKLCKNVQWYKMLDPIDKETILKRARKQQVAKKKSREYESHLHVEYGIDHYISIFQNKIRDGPFYICSVCHRLLYRKTVFILKSESDKYSLKHLFTGKKSFDNKQYICRTCDTRLSKGKVPCQAVYNNLQIDEIPQELLVLEKLEQILIAKRIVFENIVVMPKGQQRKIKGAICNVPIQCDWTCKILPRPPERSGIIMLKLKRKLQFRGHVYFQAVRPELVRQALNWLRINNPLYSDIVIDIDNIDTSLTELEQNITADNEDLNEENSVGDINNKRIADGQNIVCTNDAANDEEEEGPDPLNEYRASTNETCLQSVISDYPATTEQNEEASLGSEIYNIAPGENKHPVSFFTDKHCEEFAFSVLFPKGRFGYTAEREIKLSPVKYFNARLLHYSGQFATNPEYLFFAQFIIEQKKVSDSINIALKKVHGQPVSASQLRSNVQSLQNLICQNQAYLFLRQIPGPPPYWQKFMYEVVAMVKQLGIPTWFMTLSCADLRWSELFQIIARTQGKNMSNEEIDALSYNEKCSMLNLNPVVVAKHFQYRVETFFTEVLLSNAKPIGKIVYYALRIEFQMRGSPHLHALIWTSDCPELTHDNKEAYINFIDQHVQAYLPNEKEDPLLHELVRTYHKHIHSRTCRKYKNIQCRFSFGQFFTQPTIVAEPLSDALDEEKKMIVLNRRKEILGLVKDKIDDVLNPSKSNYDTLTESNILSSVGITEEEYYSALSISPDSGYELHLRRPIDSCFINNYFVAGIKGFAANVDLQPVFNHYKCITYVCSYFTKDESECSQAIMSAAKEAKDANMDIKDGLRKIGAAFLSTREVSSQECVYRCMPELWLRRVFPATVFVSTDLPDKRICVAKSREELDELDDESTDVFKSNIIERYTLRPKSIVTVNNLCLAQFAAYYYKDYKKEWHETSDAQPEVLTDNIVESQHVSTNGESLPKEIRLIDTNEIMKCRRIKAVIRYHTPNKRKEPEKYFHHLLMLYYPWRDESNLLARDQTYGSKFYDDEVQTVIEHNRAIFEADAEAVTEALESLRNNQGVMHSCDCINDQENDDLHSQIQDNIMEEESFNEQLPGHLDFSNNSDQDQCGGMIISYNQPSEISDDKLRECVRSLNSRQRYAYDIVLSWCRNKLKNMNSLKPEKVEYIHIFVTGGGGAGKSHLIKTIYHTVTKTFRHSVVNPELPSVLLMAPTGVDAININGTTINTALGIPKEASNNLPALVDQKRTQLRISLAELKLIIIDEISMVGNTTLLHIHQRLKEIVGKSNSELFGGISILAVGDLFQLPPIRKKPVFENFNNDIYNLYHPWHVFKMVELTEIMRQKNDQAFTELLNRFRTGSQMDEDIRCIQSRTMQALNSNYLSDALHIWAENDPVNQHNNRKLEELPGTVFLLEARDEYPASVSKQDIDKVLSRGRSKTGGLDYKILIKENARVMLTSNIDIADRLINGQMGTVIKFGFNSNTQVPRVIYVKFDDNEAGKGLIDRSNNSFAKENKVVPIECILARFKVKPAKASSPEIQRVQFPITLAWTCTVHKVQGLTLDNVVISFDLFKQRSFNYGQVYVALSRCTSLNGIHILGRLESKHVRADPRVHKEYERLRNTSPQYTTQLRNELLISENSSVVRLCVLNIRSLRKHSIDIKFDSNIFNSDVIAFTETQLVPQSNDNEIRNHLQPFALYRLDHAWDRFSSLAICTRNTVEATEYEYFREINALKFVLTRNSVTQVSRTLLLLYRKHNTSVLQYLNNLRSILSTNTIDMIVGDFNINYLDDDNIRPLKLLIDSLNYTQIIQSATFISTGSLLDQVYVKD